MIGIVKNLEVGNSGGLRTSLRLLAGTKWFRSVAKKLPATIVGESTIMIMVAPTTVQVTARLS